MVKIAIVIAAATGFVRWHNTHIYSVANTFYELGSYRKGEFVNIFVNYVNEYDL